MTRRLFLFARKKEPPPTNLAPVDFERLNAFASAYNTYVETARAGRVDLRLWRAVEVLWNKLLTTV